MRGFSFFFTLSLFLYKNIYAEDIDNATDPSLYLQANDGVTVLSNSITKSENDHRSYRMIKLRNGLQALLISDPNTQSSAASVDVGVGTYSDPDEAPGLAHFCEHLLFMGTQKYPGESHFSSFLSANSGYYNAYTSLENTNYFFQIINENFEKALDIFSQFFIHPLFSKSAVDREARAVNSEHEKNLQNDGWRGYQLEKTLSNPKSPYHKFGTGNYKTLISNIRKEGKDILEILKKFHSSYYYASLMKLAIFSNKSLDELQSIVTTYFSAVPSKDVQRPKFTEKPLTSNELGKLRWHKSIADVLTMELVFPVEGMRKSYTTGAYDYLQYLIEHKASGSIYSLLQKKGWLTDISFVREYIVSGVEFVRIQVSLTLLGLEKYEEIIYVIFQYLKMLKDVGPKEWIFNELKAISELDFRFMEMPVLYSYVSSLSSLMQETYIKHEDILTSDIPKNFSEHDIKKILEFLNPKNFVLTITSNTHPGDWDKKEEWYGTEYKIESLPATLIEKLQDIDENSLLKLPIKNIFIPEHIITKPIKENATEWPYLMNNESNFRFWLKVDESFSSPKTIVFLLLKSPIYYSSSRRAAETLYCLWDVWIVLKSFRVFINMIYDTLSDIRYYASVAGSSISIHPHYLGLYAVVHAYTEKVYDLVSPFMDAILDFYPVKSTFDFYKKELVSVYRSPSVFPYLRLGYYAHHLYYEKSWDDPSILHALQTLVYSDMLSFRVTRVSRLFLEGLSYGSVSMGFPKYIKYLLKRLRSRSVYPNQNLYSRVHVLDKGSNYIYQTDLENPHELNSAILYSLQLGSCHNSKLLSLAILLHLISKEPAFTQLRSQEQLGYVVKSAVGESAHYLDYRIMVQSRRDPTYLEQRIIAFLYRIRAMIETMTDDEFKEHISTLIILYSRKYRTLKEEANEYFERILSGTYDFEKSEFYKLQLLSINDIDSEKRVVEALKKLEKKDLEEFFHKYICPDSLIRKKLSIHLRSKTLEDVSVSDLSAERLYYFFKCEGFEIPLDDLLSLMESSITFAEFEAKLIVYLIHKYPGSKVSELIEQAFKFLKEQYIKNKQKFEKEYGAIRFSDVSSFKSSLRLSLPPSPVASFDKYYYTP
ncbi:hypothetical protein PORY_001285 [Pneumocystis oryctolagi]|uniref:Uncharacterized protein n=1 Tax=Pneumocystis oryctolagi TaxID=42067 RepID=A0ACB7CCK0_9ASCO|nr:hypothetical protein PORY_001285 [Pneumocystis oryctolagi]